MTDEQQITELTKLDGVMLGGMVELPTHPTEMVKEKSPDYLNSLDAILPVIEKVANSNFETPARIWWGIDEWLEKQGVIPALKATARQLCEGLLRLVGKWQDEPKERKV